MAEDNKRSVADKVFKAVYNTVKEHKKEVAITLGTIFYITAGSMAITKGLEPKKVESRLETDKRVFFEEMIEKYDLKKGDIKKIGDNYTINTPGREITVSLKDDRILGTIKKTGKASFIPWYHEIMNVRVNETEEESLHRCFVIGDRYLYHGKRAENRFKRTGSLPFEYVGGIHSTVGSLILEIENTK